MSDRNLTTGVIDVLPDATIYTALAVVAEFDAGDINYIDLGYPLTLDLSATATGVSFDAGGGLLAVSDISEAQQAESRSISVTLNGVDPAEAIAAINNDDWLDRDLTVYQVFLRATGGRYVSIDYPMVRFRGRMHSPQIVQDIDGGTCSVTMEVSDPLSNTAQRNGRHTNDAEQQALFSGDLGFEFVSEIPKNLKWGRV